MCECLPKGVYVSPEVGKSFTDSGFVDLYIPEYQGNRNFNGWYIFHGTL